MPDSKRAFIEEYEALCRKYGVYIHTDDDVEFLKTIEDDDFWFREHLQDLVDNEIDLDIRWSEAIDKQIAGEASDTVGFQPKVILFWNK